MSGFFFARSGVGRRECHRVLDEDISRSAVFLRCRPGRGRHCYPGAADSADAGRTGATGHAGRGPRARREASESVGIARAGLARAEGDRRRARSAYFPQLNGTASYQRTLQSQFSASGVGARIPARHPLLPATGSWRSRACPSTSGSTRWKARSNAPVPRTRSEPSRPAVRAGEHLPFRPFLFPDPVQRWATAGTDAGRWCRGSERRHRPDLGQGSAAARRDRCVLRRHPGRSAAYHRPGHAGPGRHDTESDPAGAAGRQSLRVRSAPRASDPGQPAARA